MKPMAHRPRRTSLRWEAFWALVAALELVAILYLLSWHKP